MAKKASKKKATKKGPGGRPTDYRPEYARQAQVALEAGFTIDELAELFNVGRATIFRWSHKHIALRYALKIGRITNDNRVEMRLYEKALEGDTTAMIFWLKNRRSSEWRDGKHIDHSNSDGSLQPTLDVEKLHKKLGAEGLRAIKESVNDQESDSKEAVDGKTSIKSRSWKSLMAK